MSKWKGSYDSGRTYHTEWQNEYPWVIRAKDGTQHAFCKICAKTLQPRKATLKAHSDSKDHKKRISAIGSTQDYIFLMSDGQVSDIHTHTHRYTSQPKFKLFIL